MDPTRFNGCLRTTVNLENPSPAGAESKHIHLFIITTNDLTYTAHRRNQNVSVRGTIRFEPSYCFPRFFTHGLLNAMLLFNTMTVHFSLTFWHFSLNKFAFFDLLNFYPYNVHANVTLVTCILSFLRNHIYFKTRCTCNIRIIDSILHLQDINKWRNNMSSMLISEIEIRFFVSKNIFLCVKA